MARAYHRDLRERAIGLLRRGLSKEEVARQLQIGRTTVFRWHGIWIDEERLEGRSGYQKGHSAKVEDLQEFRDFVDKNPDKTQVTLGQIWKKPCDGKTISKYLARIGYTYKKRDALPGAGCGESAGFSTEDSRAIP
jgi:transposase